MQCVPVDSHSMTCFTLQGEVKVLQPLLPFYKQPPHPDAPSVMTAEHNKGYFWFIPASWNELYLGGLLIWSTLTRAYCMSATDGKTNSIDDCNPFIVSLIQHPLESTKKPHSVPLNTTFYIYIFWLRGKMCNITSRHSIPHWLVHFWSLLWCYYGKHMKYNVQ